MTSCKLLGIISVRFPYAIGMAYYIDTKAKRDRLAKRREPYWHKVISGGYLGYRVGSTGGTWIARYRDADGKQRYKSLELPHHYAMNEFDCAIGEARKWFDGLQQGYRAAPGTMQEVADNYIERLKRKKIGRPVSDAMGRINKHILPYFQNIPLNKLTSTNIENWLDDFVKEGSEEEARKSKATANRNLAVLKAMLNQAYRRDRLFLTDQPWKSVDKFEDTHFAREDFLNAEEVKKLLDYTAGYFHDLVKAGILTGARYGELCKLKVLDLDKANNLLNIPKSKTKARTFPLTKATKSFFSKLAKNKLPEAPLLTKNGIDPWAHGDQTNLMRQAVIAAELPKTIVFYTLRHSFIADLIDKNMNVFDIAKITGTSIEMIERHYGKLFKDRVTEVLERSSLGQ